MSTTIDKKVVEMRFDNSRFERNVETTMSTLEKLKQSLNLTGASKGLENVNSAAKGIDMSSLANGVENVRLKFSALQVMGITALQNITNSAVNAGKRIVSALTIDPVKTGFSEYETKINSIQTILSNTASKGTTMDDVTRVIGELNTYADKTIYNFAEMTRNIGTFTAAGIGLEDSAASIQGIANLAAASGSTSQQASTAMYQLSQAMAAGTVKLMDWNSVVNAGMGGQKFQDALKATAKEHGVAVDDIIKKHGSFRESLSEGWISADILNQTLRKFTVEGAKDYADSMVKSGKYTQEQADALIKEAQAMEDAATKVKTFTQLWDTLKESAQSGWSQTWEIIVGDFEEAKAFLTEVSEVIGGIIGKSADARNKVLENWKVLGGRNDLLQSLKNVFEGISSIVKPISEAFREIFPPITSERLFAFTEGLKNLTAKLKLSDKTSENLKRTFKGLFAIIDIVRQIVVSAFKAIGSLTGHVGDLGGGILEVTASLGDWLVGLNESIKKGQVFDKIFGGVATVLNKVIGVIKNVGKWFKVNLIEPMLGVTEIATGMKTSVESAFDSMGAAIANCSIFKILQSVWTGITKIATGLARAFGSIVGGLFSKLANGDFQGVLDFFLGLVEGGIGIGLIQLIRTLNNGLGGLGDFKDGLLDILNGVGGILNGVGGCLESFQNRLKAETLKKIAVAVAILAASLLVLSFIDGDKLTTALTTITVLFAELMASMSIFSRIAGNMKGVAKASGAMITISIAVLILASALKVLSGMNISEMGVGLLGVAGLMALVVGTIKILGSGDNKALKGATQLLIFAAAIKILASVCEDLATLSWGELARGLAGVGILMAEIAAFIRVAKFDSKTMKTTAGIVALAAAIKILASACEDFAYMSWEEIGKGLTAVTVLLAEIVAFTKLTGNSSKVLSTGVAMIAIGAAIKIFASAIRDMGGMSWEEIAKGLISMAGSLAAVIVAMKLMPKNLIFSAAGLVVVSSALLILAEVVNRMGNMSWGEIAKGMVTLGGAMFILAAGLHAMKGTISGSAAMLVAAISLAALVPVLLILGSMSWGSIVKGLVTVAGAFAVIGIAGYALSGVAPIILMLGAAMLAAGVGLLAFGAGLSALSVGFVALVASLGAVCTGIVNLVAALIVGVIKGIGEGIIALCEVIIQGIPAIAEALIVIVYALCDVLVECIPVIVDTLYTVFISILESLSKYTPTIVDFLFGFLIGVIDGLARNIPDLIKAIFNVIMSVFEGVVEALGSIDTGTLIKGIAGIGLMAGVIMALAAIVPFIPSAMLGVLGMGAVIAELSLVLAAIGALAQIPGLKWLVSEGGNFLEAIGTAIGQFVGGVAGGIAKGFTSSLPEIGEDLSLFMENLQPFIDGASQIDSELLDGVKSLVGVILALTGANIIEGLTSWFTGGSSLTKFGKELAAFGPCIEQYASSISGIDATAVEASANAAKALAEMTNCIPNEGGMVSWFTGDSSIAKFGVELILLGKGLKGFSDAIVGIDPVAITAAADAAKTLAEMTATIPNQGGVAAWFSGENSVAQFGREVVKLGKGLKGFSDAIVGVNPEAMIAAANAAKVLAEMTSTIPNQGGMAAWFSGENSVAKFGKEVVRLGKGLKGFSDAIVGINPEAMVAAANAAKVLADMTTAIPNQGGMVTWFTGENSISKFAGELTKLGHGLKGFSDAIAGINPEAMVAAANAAKSLAEMTNCIPNEGGMVSWFKGEASISKFAGELTKLGQGLKGFSDAISGINAENLVAAANAAKALAEMTTYIPNEGGVSAWFKGDASVSKFSGDLVLLGTGLKGFSDSVTGVNAENITAAANAAKALAEMTSIIPKEGGIKAWFTGETSIANFADKLPALGKGLTEFSNSVSGINPENVSAAANAAKSLAEMLSTMPKEASDISSYGTNVVSLSQSLKKYFQNMAGIGDGSISSSKKALEAIKDISTIDSGKIKAISNAIKELTNSVKKMASGIKSDLKDAGKKAIEGFVNGIKEKIGSAENACKDLVSKCAKVISNSSDSFETAGKNVVAGFASGITANEFMAEAKAKAMAEAALKAAREALKINSPSKVFRDIGASVPEGFAMGIDKFKNMVISSSVSMGDSAITSVRNSISKIADAINSDIDAQPTIRPVLDLSAVRSGAGAIGSMFGGNSSIGVMANVGAISSMMGRRNQNGANSDVVSAIDGLRKDFKEMDRNTYNFGDISYDDGSAVSEAVAALIRAAKVERRK
jgi:tape measure domain-containing protein